MKPHLRVAVTGGAGQIAYNLLFRLGSGEVFGPEQPIILHILEVPEAIQALEGVKMELQDCAYPLLKEVIVGSDPLQVFRDIDWALLVGAKPRGPGMERADLLKENGKIFIEQGAALDKVAKKSVKVIVVGNPCNTNALIASKNAPSIPAKNFHAMTRLDQNRGSALLAAKAKLPVGEVEKMIIWGNHSNTQVPDFSHVTLARNSLYDLIDDREWLKNEFISRVQKRGAEIIAARGKSSAASAANAVIDAIKSLTSFTKEGCWFSTAVYSKDNPYGIDQDLYYSFPCRSKGNGDWEFVTGLENENWVKEKMKLSEKELIEEREMVL